MKFGFVITVFATCSIGLSTLLSAQQLGQGRGMQTASPRDSMGNHSPRTIDFTNPNAGRPVQSGSRQIPLQNLPFGQRRPDNFEQLWDQANEAKQEKQNNNLFSNFPNPFKRNADAPKPFQFPSNMNRKPNYNNGLLLTDQKPNPFRVPNLFKPIQFEKPQWMIDMNQRTKEMFSFNRNPMRQNGFGQWAQQASEDWRQKSNQAWQNFSHNINPQNWRMPGSPRNSVNPPLREANNWQDGFQNRRR